MFALEKHQTKAVCTQEFLERPLVVRASTDQTRSNAGRILVVKVIPDPEGPCAFMFGVSLLWPTHNCWTLLSKKCIIIHCPVSSRLTFHLSRLEGLHTEFSWSESTPTLWKTEQQWWFWKKRGWIGRVHGLTVYSWRTAWAWCPLHKPRQWKRRSGGW